MSTQINQSNISSLIEPLTKLSLIDYLYIIAAIITIIGFVIGFMKYKQKRIDHKNTKSLIFIVITLCFAFFIYQQSELDLANSEFLSYLKAIGNYVIYFALIITIEDPLDRLTRVILKKYG